MDEATAALGALRKLRQRRDNYEAEERAAVLRARRAGLTWRAIAEALERDASTVWTKYNRSG
jgi:DNA-binding NarL/FixJ family response regulator